MKPMRLNTRQKYPCLMLVKKGVVHGLVYKTLLMYTVSGSAFPYLPGFISLLPQHVKTVFD